MGPKSSHMGVTGKLWLGSVSVALHWEFLICISYKMLDELFIISCLLPPPVYSSSSRSAYLGLG